MSGIKFALIESIKKSRPIKSEAPPPPTKIYDKTQTRYGLISITIRGDDWRTGNIYINKVKIPIDEASISVKEKWEIGSKDVLLVSTADGGSACPSLYVFLIVTEKQVLASEEFGTCSDIPEVSRIKDTIIVKLPQMGGDGVETTKYEDGKVYGIVTRWVNDHNVSKPGELKLETIAF